MKRERDGSEKEKEESDSSSSEDEENWPYEPPDTESEEDEFSFYDDNQPTKESPSNFFKEEWKHKTTQGLTQKIEKGEPIIFQQFEADYYIPSYGNDPVVRIYGCDEEGNNITVRVYGFQPYFYLLIDQDHEDFSAHEFQKLLAEELDDKEKKLSKKVKQKDIEWIRKIEIQDKDIFMKFNPNTSKVFKIWVGLPNYVPFIRKHLENVDGSRIGFSTMLTCESNVGFALRCLIDCDIRGSTWIELTNYKECQKTTYCNAEFGVSYKNIRQIPQEGKYAKSAPFRLLSTDIECASIDGNFPQATSSPVVTISNVVCRHGSEVINDKVNSQFQVLFTLKGCAPIEGAEIYSFDNEENMLIAWRNFFVTIDPCIITGYNLGFDIPYLWERADALGVSGEFKKLSKIIGGSTFVKETTTTSKQRGTRKTKKVDLKGRTYLDPFVIISTEYKLSSYSLNFVSAEFLGDQKADVPHSKIPKLANGSDWDRRRLAMYCLKDALLPIRLLVKKMLHLNTIQLSRITGVMLGSVYERGQMSRIVSQILRKLKSTNYIMPTLRERPKEETKGGLVVKTKPGYYDKTKPIVVLDFASLYPSIMIAYNACYTTLISLALIKQLGYVEGVDYYKLEIKDLEVPMTTYFVTPKIRKGIIPEILMNLLSQRDLAKGQMFEYSKEGKTPDKELETIWNLIQLVLKICANSVYGFTGAVFSPLYEPKISNTVTAHGRRLNQFTQDWILEHFPGSIIVAGDTDSVMVWFKVNGKMLDNVPDAIKFGKQVAGFVTEAINMKPLKITFEKVGCPSLFDKKKRYAILFWTKPDKADKVYITGFEAKRRDCSGLTRLCMKQALHYSLEKGEPELAIKFVQDKVSKLYSNEIDVSELVITKQITKDPKDYKTKQPHLESAKRKSQRDTFYKPNIGDRVPFVVVDKGKAPEFARKGGKLTKKKLGTCDKTEDPLFVLRGKLKIDTEYYIEKQLKKPLSKIFLPIFGSKEKMNSTLYSGDHTKKRVVHVPKEKKGILAFATVLIRRCQLCRVLLGNDETGVCSSCNELRLVTAEGLECKLVELKNESKKLWDKCIECGSYENQKEAAEDCTEIDCPQFYRRESVLSVIMDTEKELSELKTK